MHQEACIHLHRTIQEIKSFGKKAAVALNPATPVCSLKNVLRDVDMVLIMTVNPGFGGQRYIETMTEKIGELKALRDEMGLSFEIEVDGGIDESTVKAASKAGAEVFVAGSAVFCAPDVKAAIDNIRNAAISAKKE